MSGAIGQIIGNLAFVALVMSSLPYASVWFRRVLPRYEYLCLGLVASIAAIGSMLLAVECSPGAFVDLRYGPILVAALFGGAAPAIVATCLATALGLVAGGTGAADGMIFAAAAVCTGVLTNLRLCRRSPTTQDILLTGIAMAVAFTLALPLVHRAADIHELFMSGLPGVASNSIAAVVCGLIVLKTRNSELERSILVTAFSQAPDFLYVKDRNSKFVTVNQNMVRLHGCETPEQMVGLSDFDTMERSHAQELYDSEQEMMRTGTPLVDTLEQMEGRFYLASKAPVQDAHGCVIGLAGVTREITERIALERDLRDSKNLLTYAMAGMSDGFAMFDSQGFLVFCNDQYRDAFPWSADARRPGAHIRDILRRMIETREHPAAPREAAEDWIETATCKLHSNNDEEIQLPNGDWRSIKTRLAEDGTAMVVVSDITAMKHAEMALRLSAEHMKNLAETDGLTGIANRRAFDEAFAREVARSAAQNTPLSLLMIDIDRFKAYNDAYGHPAGDRCLRLVSMCLAGAKRPMDVIARYGGEEFVALLPDTSQAAAVSIAEQFALCLAQENIAHSASEFGKLTASIGIATAQDHSLNGEPGYLLEMADEALYQAKKQGRNRIVAGEVFDRRAGELKGNKIAVHFKRA